MQEIKVGVVGYGQNSCNREHQGGRGADLLRLATTAFEGIKAAAICDTDPKTLDIARSSTLKSYMAIKIGIDTTRPEYADKRELGHGGMDYILWDLFFKAIRTGSPSPISLKDGLCMTLPGIYAAESASRGGELMQIKYPWNS